MVPLDAIFEYRLPGLLIHRDLFGQRLDVPGQQAWIQFPDDDYGQDGGPLFRSSGVVAGWNEDRSGKGRTAIVINAMLVGIPLELDLDPASPEKEVVQTALKDASSRAREVFVGLTDWLRVDREHFWFASKATLATAHEVAGALFDREGNQLHHGYVITTGSGGKVKIYKHLLTHVISRVSALDTRGQDHVLSTDDAKAALDLVARRTEPELWDLLLADAYSLVGLHYSVVLAAIACETAVKTVLSESSTQEQKELVELLLSSPRDYSLAARSLFDEPCRIILGRSLRDDDRTLYKRIVRLFEDRNRIVHKMAVNEAELDRLRDDILAAGDAIDWLMKHKQQ